MEITSHTQGTILLIDDTYTINYTIDSERNVFIRRYASMDCPMCNTIVNQYVGMGYYENMEFDATDLEKHIRLNHNDVLCIKSSVTCSKKKTVKLVLTKKVVL